MVAVRGHARHWGVYAAAGIGVCLLLTTGALAQNKSEDNGQKSGQAQPAAQNNQAAPTYRVTVLALPICPKDTKKGQTEVCGPKERSEYLVPFLLDWFDAHNGTVNAIFSGFLAIFTAVLAIFTFKLFQVGRDQHDRLKETIDHAKDSSERQLRAYILVEATGLEDLVDGGSPRAAVTFRNVGQTPAYEVVCHGRMAICPFPLQEDLPALNWSEVRRSKEPLGPTLKRSKTEVGFPVLGEVPHLFGLRSGDWAIYVYGEIRYKDAFDKPHTTKYRFFSGGLIGIESGLTAYHEGNEAD
jgi:hypothetical protein